MNIARPSSGNRGRGVNLYKPARFVRIFPPARFPIACKNGCLRRGYEDEGVLMPEETVHCAVLIVEDDESVMQLLRAILARFCSNVEFARDGEEAITKLQNGSYDIVILDLMLPKVNGFKVAEVMNTLPKRPGVIVLSAISRYFADQFPPGTVVLQKPFEINHIEEAVRALQG
jgi:CheY-like chemotaxis protein